MKGGFVGIYTTHLVRNYRATHTVKSNLHSLKGVQNKLDQRIRDTEINSRERSSASFAPAPAPAPTPTPSLSNLADHAAIAWQLLNIHLAIH